MRDHNECIFKEEIAQDNLKEWYVHKLRKIKETSTYEEHLNCTDLLGNSLLHAAVYAEDIDTLRCLVRLKHVNLDVINGINSMSPLVLCLCLSLNPELARCLIEAGCDVNTTFGPLEMSPLMVTVHTDGTPQMAKLLLDFGADVNAASNLGDTVLHTAVRKQSYEFVSFLLLHGADVNEPNDEGDTPFTIALRRRDVELFDSLFEYVTDICNLNWLALALLYPTKRIFKLIWSRFNFKEVYVDTTRNILLTFKSCKLPKDDWLECLNLLTMSELFEDIVLDLYKRRFYYNKDDNTLIPFDSIPTYLGCIFHKRKIPEELFHEYLVSFLTKGEAVYYQGIESVYRTYGYGQTLKTLLLMDVLPSNCSFSFLPFFICNLSKDESEVIYRSFVKDLSIFDVPLDKREQRLCLFDRYPELHGYFCKTGSVQSLAEIARNAARKALYRICRKKTCCQFYTVLNRLKVPVWVEDVLSYKEPIYFVDEL